MSTIDGRLYGGRVCHTWIEDGELALWGGGTRPAYRTICHGRLGRRARRVMREAIIVDDPPKRPCPRCAKRRPRDMELLTPEQRRVLLKFSREDADGA